MAIFIGMKPSIVLDYLETCIGNNLNMKGDLLGIILYACLEAFNVKIFCFVLADPTKPGAALQSPLSLTHSLFE